MTDFLSSLKADLLDRRLLPLVVLVAVALAGALGYALLGGGSSATTTPAVTLATAPATTHAGLPISQSNPEQAVAETTGGVSAQHKGLAHNPFIPLPEAKAATSTTTTTSAASSSTSASSSGSSGTSESSSSSQGSSGATPEPSKPAKPKTVYHVAVLFGVLPVATTPLTPYENLKLLAPLPSAKDALILFRGVTAGGKSATFTVVGEAILHGNATCLPSAARCEAIDLQPGQSEQLETLSPTGQAVDYELQIVSITSAEASSAAAKSVLRGESKAGRELLSRSGLVAIPDLRYSSHAGVLVFAGHPAFAAGARHSR
jgi:hypothetical protein